MRNFSLLSAFLITAFAGLNAQSLLWEITGKGIQKSYLYGTIHIQDKRVFQYDKIVEEKLMECDAYAMELLIDEIKKEDIEKSMYMKNKTLKDLLSTEDYKMLDSVLKAKMGMGLIMFNKMKPFFLSSQLMQIEMSKDMDDALDMYFLKKARESGKQVFGIEQLSDQIGAIDQISLEEQCQMLIESVKDTSKEEQKFDELLYAYLLGNLDTMLVLSSDTSLPAKFNKAFLIDRNAGMAKNIAKISKNYKTFHAIGAAHLGGEKGIIALLRKKGYKVDPVEFKFDN
ncbi:MAG: TraB/GumN family protein [Bacteroidota bacterium]